MKRLNEKVIIMKCTCCGKEHVDSERYCEWCGEVNEPKKINRY